MAKKIKYDFTDLYLMPADLRYNSIAAAKIASARVIKREFKRAKTSMRKDLRAGSTLSTASRKKRFLHTTRTSGRYRLSQMRGKLFVGNWKEPIGSYTKGRPKFVKRKKNKRYYRPKLTTLGVKSVVVQTKKMFQPYKYKKSSERGNKQGKTGGPKFMKNVFIRSGKSSLPLRDGPLQRKLQTTVSMYTLMTSRTTIARRAFDKIRSKVSTSIRHEMNYEMDKRLKGRPKPRNGNLK